jgi:hypothetical protein
MSRPLSKTTILRVFCVERLWPKGQMYLGSIEEAEGAEGEAATEVVTGAVIVAEEGDTVPTGAPVDGTFKVMEHNTVCTDSH